MLLAAIIVKQELAIRQQIFFVSFFLGTIKSQEREAKIDKSCVLLWKVG